MCFTAEDIQWFKPVELRTKYGRRGHIKEPLGKMGLLLLCTTSLAPLPPHPPVFPPPEPSPPPSSLLSPPHPLSQVLMVT